MATLSLTDDQVAQLVKQLAPEAKRRVMSDLIAEGDSWWTATAKAGEADMRELAKAHGQNWDVMPDAEREKFVDGLLHEK